MCDCIDMFFLVFPGRLSIPARSYDSRRYVFPSPKVSECFVSVIMPLYTQKFLYLCTHFAPPSIAPAFSLLYPMTPAFHSQIVDSLSSYLINRRMRFKYDTYHYLQRISLLRLCLQ